MRARDQSIEAADPIDTSEAENAPLAGQRSSTLAESGATADFGSSALGSTLWQFDLGKLQTLQPVPGKRIDGGEGNDTIQGGDGDDDLRGWEGDDVVYGGA